MIENPEQSHRAGDMPDRTVKREKKEECFE